MLPKLENEGFPITAIREIKLLKQLSHGNVIKLMEVVFDESTSSTYMVFPFMKHDLVGAQDYRGKNGFSVSEIKCIFHQLLTGLEYLHSHKVIHRDLKLANLLISECGTLKIADFGLARLQGSPHQTNRVITRWYRPPELLLGVTEYGSSVDVWSAGAIFGELVIGKPLFPGESEMNVLGYIFDTLGYPHDWIRNTNLPFAHEMIPEVNIRPTTRKGTSFRLLCKDLSLIGISLILSMLKYNPAQRATASNILQHEYFKEKPQACNETDIHLCPQPRRELHVKNSINWDRPKLSTKQTTKKRGRNYL